MSRGRHRTRRTCLRSRFLSGLRARQDSVCIFLEHGTSRHPRPGSSRTLAHRKTSLLVGAECTSSVTGGSPSATFRSFPAPAHLLLGEGSFESCLWIDSNRASSEHRAAAEAGPQDPSPLPNSGLASLVRSFWLRYACNPIRGAPCQSWREPPKGFFSNPLTFSRMQVSPKEVK